MGIEKMGAMGGFGGFAPVGRQTFGAAVVTKTLDYMGGRGAFSHAPVDKASFGAAVVSGTLDLMNTDPFSGKSDPFYESQKSILAAHTLKGGLFGRKA